MSNSKLVTGEAGIALIKEFEGVKLSKYKDVVGKWTIGCGHLILLKDRYPAPLTDAQAQAVQNLTDTTPPADLFPLPLTNAQMELLLHADLFVSEKGVNDNVRVPLTQNQFDALVSFTFNLGVGNLKSSTLLKILNEGQYLQAAEQFLRWDKAGGATITGLTRRRQAERALFLR
ncbi:muraminidase [Rahnella victoriana]|uniref:lysozyme n=1 Tax=Rahnella victoriana TaxID=1510570 RepID=UPI000BB19710|nr:lysozyme [Rahnella victoriana]PBI81388.1 muraminidase [Rahnella victoriana]